MKRRTFTLTNPNEGLPLSGLTFSDDLPTGLEVNNPPAPSNTCGGTLSADDGATTIDLSEGSLAADSSCTISVQILATSAGTKDNTSGNQLTYSLLVMNGGPDTATNVVVTDTLPAGVTFVSSTPGSPTCTVSSGTVTCNLGDLADGEDTIVSITVTTPSVTEATSLTNDAYVSSDAEDPDEDNNADTEETTVEAPQSGIANLSIDKTDEGDPITLGQGNIHYLLTVTNHGPDPAPSTVVTDALPGGVLFISATFPCTESGGIVTCNLGTLDSDEVINLEIVVAPVEPGTISNTAIVSSAVSEAVSDDNSDSEETVIRERPVKPPTQDQEEEEEVLTPQIVVVDPALSKAGSPMAATVGERVVWTITVRNPGSVPTNPVTVTDDVPSMFDIVKVSSTLGSTSFSGDSVTISVPALQPGEQMVITVDTVANDSALPREVCNSATMNGTHATACIGMYPRLLPQTGGRPSSGALTAWVAASTILGLGGLCLLMKQRSAQR